MTSYWVIGAPYTCTNFTDIREGAEQDRHGPFETYQDAYAEWSSHAWRTVDDCFIRYHIVDDHGVAVSHN